MEYEIRNKEDFVYWTSLRPKTKYYYIKFNFKCCECHCEYSKTLKRIKAFPIKCERCLIKETNYKKYGCITPSQNQEIKEKTKQTFLKKYGVTAPIFIPEVRKMQEKTMIERYGSIHALQNDEILKKAEETCEKHFGTKHAIQNKEIKEKIKNTCLEKYGYDSPFKVPQFKEKCKQTSLKHYGVEHPMQCHEVMCKHNQKYKYDGLLFDSKPEIEFYKILKRCNADFEYHPNISFEYEHNNKKT